jgi:hypothetical protein
VALCLPGGLSPTRPSGQWGLRDEGLRWLLPVGRVQLAQITREALLELRSAPFYLRPREVPIAIVHRLELAAVDAHQIGGALAAFGAGAVRSFTGDYLLAFMMSGFACLLASLLVLRVTRPASEIVPAV